MNKQKCKYCKALIKACFDRGEVCFSCTAISESFRAFLITMGVDQMRLSAKAKEYWLKPAESLFYHLQTLNDKNKNT